MSDDNEVIVELLRDVLGEEKQHYSGKGQIAFNCPSCDEDRNKGNLEVNYFSHVFKCWSCGESDDMKGPLGKLMDKYANKKQKKLYKLLKPEEDKVIEKKKPKLKLPDSFKFFKHTSTVYPVRRQAHNYLSDRKSTRLNSSHMSESRMPSSA